MKALILTSPTTSRYISQSSIYYLAKFLSQINIETDILDFSGRINFFDPPREMFENQIDLWQSPLIFNESWIDNYIPECREGYDYIYASALFSTDIILQGRYVKKCKEVEPKVKTRIGGSAVKNLNSNQIKTISSVFNIVFKGNLLVTPKYDLDSYKLKEFVTVATGTGCDWGKCLFCNSGKEKYSLRNLDEIVEEFIYISEISDSEIMLSSDSISINKINDLSLKLFNAGNTQKYSLMLRADKKVDKAFSENLKMSGCYDVFIGVEIFDDDGLKLINKGTTVATIKNTVKNLSKVGMDIQLGIIVFLPSIMEYQLENQLNNLEEILPYIHGIDLTSLSILYKSDYYNNSAKYGINLYPDKNIISSGWCYGLSQDVPWGFKDDINYYMWERHINSLRKMLYGYVDEEYWWEIDYIMENWK